MRIAFAGLPLLAVLAACNDGGGAPPPATASAAPPAAASAPTAVVIARDAAGAEKARANLAQVSQGLKVSVQAMGMTPGTYGIHLHMVGRCDGPEFTSAGGHWNPTGAMHGMNAPQGPHHGDLPNLVIGADGRGAIDFTVAGATLTGAQGLLDADGGALVIHAQADDYRTDPAGNSGARVICGVATAG